MQIGYIANSDRNKYTLTLDGISVDGVVSVYSEREKDITTADNLGIHRLISLKWIEIPIEYVMITLSFLPILSFNDIKGVYFLRDRNKMSIHYIFDLDSKNWKRSYSILEFSASMSYCISETKGYLAKWDDSNDFDPIYELSFTVDNGQIYLRDILEEYNIVTEDICKRCFNYLRSTHKGDSIISVFQFPNDVKVACEQYLLYFVQFLKDIGIEANANLEQQTGQVLFSVTPKDENEALDKIRQALEIYLRLPTNPSIATSITPYSDVESQRLASNILHLQSQLMLAHATIRQQESHIQRQELLIQQQLLSGEVLIQSLVYDSTEVRKIEKGQKEAEDKESLLGDIVHVRKWEPDDVPLSVDLPSIFRWLKKLFGKNE